MTVVEGVLGLGTVVLYNGGNKKLKEFVIQETYLNPWSSKHLIKSYSNGLPQKYMKMVESAL